MQTIFYLSAGVAVVSTLLMITRLNAVHALLYLIVSLLAVALIFYTLGAPFVAALEVIIYAGAIMVLFVFVMMMLNLGERATSVERAWLDRTSWAGPLILAAILIGEIAYLLSAGHAAEAGAAPSVLTDRASQAAETGVIVGAHQVGLTLFGPYLLGVELASMLLLGGLVGAYHVGQRARRDLAEAYERDSDAGRAAAGGDSVRAGAGRPARPA